MTDPELLRVAVVAAVVAALAAALGGVLVRGSTAVPAAVWAMAACGALAVELGLRSAGLLTEPGAGAAARLVAAALSVCPAMSLLGAKRPQHGVWQFIVATLAVVLSLPAATATLVRPGSLPDVHPLVRWFLLGLVGIGWMNFVGTRRFWAAGLVTAGQLVLLRGLLPAGQAWDSGTGPLCDAAGAVAVACGAVSAAAVSLVAAGRSRGTPVTATDLPSRINPSFLALRETLGAAWTLRLAERFDVIATKRGWPCRLSFAGLEGDAGERDAQTAADWQRDAIRGFRALMRRFVTDAWLERHGSSEPLGPASRTARGPGTRADSWPASAAAGTLPPR